MSRNSARRTGASGEGREDVPAPPELAAVFATLREEGRAWAGAVAPAQLPPELKLASQRRQALGTWRRGAGWAVAAAAASLAALVWLGPWSSPGFGPRSRRLPESWLPSASAPVAVAPPARVMAASLPLSPAGAFLPLTANVPASGFVVRVDLPAGDLASLGIAAAPGSGSVPAEVLLNDNGVPCGIRFLPNPGDAGTAAGEK